MWTLTHITHAHYIHVPVELMRGSNKYKYKPLMTIMITARLISASELYISVKSSKIFTEVLTYIVKTRLPS